jgi:hypothetical protein
VIGYPVFRFKNYRHNVKIDEFIISFFFSIRFSSKSLKMDEDLINRIY